MTPSPATTVHGDHARLVIRAKLAGLVKAAEADAGTYSADAWRRKLAPLVDALRIAP